MNMLFFFQAEDGMRDIGVTGVQTCALPICRRGGAHRRRGAHRGRHRGRDGGRPRRRRRRRHPHPGRRGDAQRLRRLRGAARAPSARGAAARPRLGRRRRRGGGPGHPHRRPARRHAADPPDRGARGPGRTAGPAAAARGRRRRRGQHRARPAGRDRADRRARRVGRRGGGAGMSGEQGGPLPVVAIVGRPNVGKSTLVNRFLGRRAAVVQDVPGVTRDRIAYEALWNGKSFTVVDTGGWEPKATGMAAAIARQAEYAMKTADVIVLVVDASVGATETDLAAARVLRRSDRPVILVANKVDDERAEAGAAELWSLGLGEPYTVSALHGRGSGDLLDLVLDAMPAAPRETEEVGGPRRVALVGRPNVGKASLINRLSKEERSVVDSVAGTTVDPVDSIVRLGGEEWRFVDTAGLRRKVNTASGMEYYASLRTEAAIQAAEVAEIGRAHVGTPVTPISRMPS